MKNEKGQAVVIFLVMILPLCFLLFSVARVTLAVRARMKLQNAADAAALSAAAWQARALNQAATANAALAGLALLRESVLAGTGASEVRTARLLLIDIETRKVDEAKREALRLAPGCAADAARENGRKTLGVAQTEPDAGAQAFGPEGPWRFQPEARGPVDDTAHNRLTGAAWQNGNGYALAAARAESGRSAVAGIPMFVPDFKERLIPVALSGAAYDYLKSVTSAGLVIETLREINETIEH